MIKPKKLFLALISFVLSIVIILLTLTVVSSFTVISTRDKVFEAQNVPQDTKYDCILVLGAGIRGTEPSDMLKDRLDVAITLYSAKIAPKLLMSGDHISDDYNEVGVMKAYAVSQGIPSEDIFIDHEGISTYDSIRNARERFGIQSMVIGTQGYHLPRALYIAQSFDMRVCGVGADLRKYIGSLYYYRAREVLARNKDVFKCIFGDPIDQSQQKIDITGNGDITNNR